MIDQGVAMAAILVTWATMAVAIVGLGLGCRAVVDTEPPRGVDQLLGCFWSGLAACIALVQVWHLVMPVNGLAAVTALGVGAACVSVTVGDAWIRRSRGPRRRHHPGLVASLVLFLVWMANRATGPGDYGDTGSYHLAGIRWAAEYPIVPGVANLNDHLGFNNAVFLLNAMCEAVGWQGRSSHVVNALIIAAVGVQGIVGMYRLWRSTDEGPSATDAFAAILFPAAVTAAVGREVSSPMTDLAAGVMILMAVSGLFRLAIDDRSRGNAFGLMTAGCASASVCLKVTVALAGLMVTLCLPFLLRRRGVPWRMIALITIAPGCLLVLPWCARGVLLSGYPLFPSLALPFGVDWRLAPERVLPIQVFAANSGMIWWGSVGDIPTVPVDRTWGWFVMWLTKVAIRDTPTVAVPLLLTLAFGAGFIARRGDAWKRLDGRAWLIAWIPVGASIAFWYFTCPAPRMGMWVLWSMAAGSGALVLGSGGMRALWVRRTLIAILLGTSLFAIGHRTAWWVHYHRSTGRPAAINPLVRSVWMPPGPDHGLHPCPTAELVSRTNRWGVTVNMPRTGHATWWAPLPATYNDITNLRLRRPGDLAHGFITDTGPSPPAGSAGAAEEAVTP